MWHFKGTAPALSFLIFLSGCAREPPEVTNARMWQAILNGDSATVAKSLSQGADANLSTPEGVSALMLAASTGNSGTVETLLSQGARPDDKTKEDGLTALMFAAKACSRSSAEALLAAQADAKLVDSSKGSAADWALRGCKDTKEAADLITYLHENGASILPRGDVLGLFLAEGTSPPMDSVLARARSHFRSGEL